ncbi:MarC family protein [Parendozoicomonas sp. Alg238-R29]|uniref:MarC family protein n=1 Tax=Parendozoicomonas sp. Alg238-R29 TaxID=2993446 RepID=UPI00248E5901|nr:MarC family protein [Parendozoicomonas sp. Alg238-R29]
MSPTMAEFGVLCLTSLFTMINPISIAPVFLSLTSGLEPYQRKQVARKATLTAFVILVFFALTGSVIFQVFGISVHGLRIVGGVLFFIMGYEMVQARLSRTRFDKAEELEAIDAYSHDVALTPLAIPLICGPGAIATVIILMQEQTLTHQMILFVSIAAVLLVTWVALLFASPIMNRVGESGNKVMMRVMGLIVMVIAVEYFFAGLKPIMRDILGIPA